MSYICLDKNLMLKISNIMQIPRVIFLIILVSFVNLISVDIWHHHCIDSHTSDEIIFHVPDHSSDHNILNECGCLLCNLHSQIHYFTGEKVKPYKIIIAISNNAVSDKSFIPRYSIRDISGRSPPVFN